MNKLIMSALVTLTLSCQRTTPGAEVREDTSPAAKGAPATAPKPSADVTSAPAAQVEVAGLATCRPTDDVRGVVSRVTDLADTDGNGEISRLEAQSALNFMLGGFFVRADQNGDGKVTPAEGRQVREQLEQRHPAIASLLARAREATGQSPLRAVADLSDVKYDQTLSLEQVRSAARGALDDLFRLTDANKDNVITRAEASDAGRAGAHSLASRTFTATDANRDQFVDEGEFKGALDASAKSAFKLADQNHDGRLSREESALALANIGRLIGAPAP